MKKHILTIAIAAVTIVFILAIVACFTGSLEMYPTPEQTEKCRIAALTAAGIALAADGGLIWLRLKTKK